MSTVASSGYSVARAMGKCSACARDIATGEKLLAGLRETNALLQRVDVCPTCWESFDKTGLLGYWQTIMPAPTARKRVFVDDDVLCDLFERLADTTEPSKLGFRYVLGLILMRKRRVVYDSTRIDGDKEIWTVHMRGSEQSIDLLNPRIDEQQIAQLSTQLDEILNSEA